MQGLSIKHILSNFNMFKITLSEDLLYVEDARKTYTYQ